MKDFDDNNKAHNPSDEAFVHDEGMIPDDSLLDVHEQLMREKKEPTEKDTPFPAWLMLFCGIILFWGGFYLAFYSGDFRADSFNFLVKPGTQTAATEEVFDPIARGAKLFARNCQQCHQADGKGVEGVYPPLAGSPWIADGTKERPIRILLAGLTGPIEVLGNTYEGNMPSFAHWKDRDIAAVLTYIRQNYGNNADEIPEELVTEIRSNSERKKPWTAKELLALYPLG